MVHHELRITGMTCEHCSESVSDALNRLQGVQANHSPAISKSLLVQQQTQRVEELRTAKYEDIFEANDNIHLVRGWAKFKTDQPGCAG